MLEDSSTNSDDDDNLVAIAKSFTFLESYRELIKIKVFEHVLIYGPETCNCPFPNFCNGLVLNFHILLAVCISVTIPCSMRRILMNKNLLFL
jgi:hypothetical protein